MTDISPEVGQVMTRLRTAINSPENYARINRLSENKPMVREFLHDIYGNDINHLEGVFPQEFVSKGEVRNYTSLFDGFYRYALDTGLARRVEFDANGVIPGRSEKMVAEPVAMFRRSAFIDKVQTELDGMKDPKAAFLMLDLANLRSADMVTDKAGNRYADIILNNFAGALQEAIAEVKNELLVGDYRDLKAFACRYGGDEFSIAVMGDYDSEILDRVKEKIKQKVDAIETPGYYEESKNYKKRGRIVEGKIAIKENKIETLELPQTDSFARTIFLHYLGQGLILDPSQIEYIKEDYGEERYFRSNVVRRKEDRNPYYRMVGDKMEYVTELEDKISIVLERHPELSVVYNIAEAFDKGEAEKTGSKVTRRRENLLRFTERTLYDPLLGTNVYNFFDFTEHLQEEQFRDLYVFDLKLKELNDLKGYAFADRMLTHFYSEMRLPLSQNGDLSKVMIGRQGGTFFMAVREGQQLSEASLAEIRSYFSGNFEYMEGRGFDGVKRIKMPIGSVGIYPNESGKPVLINRPTGLKSAMTDVRLLQSREAIQEALKKSNSDFYRKMTRMLSSNPWLFSTLEKDEPPNTGRTNIETEDILWHYFKGKRWLRRCDEMITYLESTRDIDIDERKYMIGFFRKIIEEKSQLGESMELA